MKALMVNSTSANIVTEKMRDELYMKHLREVQKINNRQAETIKKDVKNYHSISQFHQKYKAYAFQWNSKEQCSSIEARNNKMIKKLHQIKSYYGNNKSSMGNSKVSEKEPTQVIQTSRQEVKRVNEEENEKSLQKQRKKQKKMKKLQQEIQLQNQKIRKGILSQRSSYLPKINNVKLKKAIKNDQQKQTNEKKQ